MAAVATDAGTVPAATEVAAPPLASAPQGVTRTIRERGGPHQAPAVANVPSQSASDRLAAAAASMTAGKAPPAPEPPAQDEVTEPPSPAPPEPAKPNGKAVDPPKQDAAPAEQPKPSEDAKERELLQRRLAIVAEKERRAFQKEQQAAAKLAAREAEIAAREQALKDFEALKAKAKADPAAFLRATGLSFEELARGVIADKSKPIPSADELREELRKQLLDEVRAEARKEAEALQAKSREAQAAAYEQQLRHNAVQIVRAAPDKYPQTILEGREAEVFDYAKAVYLQGDPARGFKKGHELSFDKAADVVETFLRERRVQTFGPHTDKLRSFYASFGSTPNTATTTAANEPGKSLPAKPDAGNKGAESKSKGPRGKERDPVGRFSKTVSTGTAKAASADDEDLAGLDFEEYREALKRRAIKSLG